MDKRNHWTSRIIALLALIFMFGGAAACGSDDPGGTDNQTNQPTSGLDAGDDTGGEEDIGGDDVGHQPDVDDDARDEPDADAGDDPDTDLPDDAPEALDDFLVCEII